MELQPDRRLSNRRIYPAIDLVASSTRREDLLLGKEQLQRMWILSNHLADMNSEEAMDFILNHMRGTRSNEEFLVSMNKISSRDCPITDNQFLTYAQTRPSVYIVSLITCDRPTLYFSAITLNTSPRLHRMNHLRRRGRT